MGGILISLVVLVVVGYFVLVAMGVIGAAKKSAEEADRDGAAGESGKKKRGFFG